MRTLITGIIIFTGWGIFSNYWYVCKIKNLCGEETAYVATAPVELTEADTEAEETNTEALVQAIEETIILFEFDSTLVLNEQELQRVSDQLTILKPEEMLLEGHTCNIGTENYNYHLGKRRAERVKQAFIRQGLPAENIKTTSEGETDPRVPNTSPEKREMNRRVILLIQEK